MTYREVFTTDDNSSCTDKDVAVWRKLLKIWRDGGGFAVLEKKARENTMSMFSHIAQLSDKQLGVILDALKELDIKITEMKTQHKHLKNINQQNDFNSKPSGPTLFTLVAQFLDSLPKELKPLFKYGAEQRSYIMKGILKFQNDFSINFTHQFQMASLTAQGRIYEIFGETGLLVGEWGSRARKYTDGKKKEFDEYKQGVMIEMVAWSKDVDALTPMIQEHGESRDWIDKRASKFQQEYTRDHEKLIQDYRNDMEELKRQQEKAGVTVSRLNEAKDRLYSGPEEAQKTIADFVRAFNKRFYQLTGGTIKTRLWNYIYHNALCTAVFQQINGGNEKVNFDWHEEDLPEDAVLAFEVKGTHAHLEITVYQDGHSDIVRPILIRSD